MTTEEYLKLSSSDQMRYRLSLPDEQRKELHRNAMWYLFKQKFSATQDEVMELCEETKKKYNCSSECAAKLVELTLQLMTLQG
jgi:hypothetical protein